MSTYAVGEQEPKVVGGISRCKLRSEAEDIGILGMPGPGRSKVDQGSSGATSVAGLIVTASVWVPVPPALVALRVTVEAPALVGVPAMSPLVASSARPAGNPVAPKLVGLFVAGRLYA